jgi:hypothetical protein
MEVLKDLMSNRLSKRYIALNYLEYYIEESVYYRSFSEDIHIDKRQVLYTSPNEEGKVELQ